LRKKAYASKDNTTHFPQAIKIIFTTSTTNIKCLTKQKGSEKHKTKNRKKQTAVLRAAAAITLVVSFFFFVIFVL